MKRRVCILLLLMSVTIAAQSGPAKYPDAKKAAQADNFFGTTIADPYRWLEDADAPETRAWIEAENKVTFGYLDQIPERARVKERLTKLWNYERYGAPSREGEWYIFSKNDGLQNQSVIYKTKSLDAAPEVLLDPNTLSADGTVALGAESFSDDGRYMAYSIAAAGSDWQEWKIREVATGKDLPDTLKWSKFSGAAWLKDGSGFFYSRYDAPTDGRSLQAVNKNQKLMFHAVQTPQTADRLVYERPDKPDWSFAADVSDDGRFLLVYQTEGTDNRNRVFVRDLKNPLSQIEPFLNDFDASYSIVGNDGDMFYVLTNNDAPRYRLVFINRKKLAAGAMTVIPEARGRDVLESVTIINEQFVTVWMTDAKSAIRVYDLDGTSPKEITLPGIGSVPELHGRRKHAEAFYAFTSFIYPTTIYRYDFGRQTSSVFKKPSVDFDASRYETVQVFYTAKDSTKIPMFITHAKRMAKNGRNPTQLYGYGGFNIAITPSFSPAIAAWLEMGGVYAVANIRGGGEYGQAWYDAGRLKNKQTVFDDFIAAAEYLIQDKYTSAPSLAISGGSNGGLLVGACLTQRPDLFGAALPAVGVMDMLRYHKFTIGWAWKSDYGDPETKEGFEINVKYSPLHTIKAGTKYPATLVTTADHDDRVVPAHSFKFAATLQAAQAGPAPVLIRIETKAGHGAGKPTTKQIEEKADVFGFLLKELKMTLPSTFGLGTAK
ncbi:MAG: prolyl oligopeptidase family serine peptidase [Acidobacteriota bacterium]